MTHSMLFGCPMHGLKGVLLNVSSMSRKPSQSNKLILEQPLYFINQTGGQSSWVCLSGMHADTDALDNICPPASPVFSEEKMKLIG
jgi:hypothetical protein